MSRNFADCAGVSATLGARYATLRSNDGRAPAKGAAMLAAPEVRLPFRAILTGAIVTMALAVAGCSVDRAADMMPLNDTATANGIPRLDMTLYGTGYGPATVTMPDGEVLNGHYRLALGGAVATTVGTANGPGGAAVVSGSSTVSQMQGPFTVQAVGGKGTTMTCEGSAGGLGHGGAVCVFNQGARYQMMF